MNTGAAAMVRPGTCPKCHSHNVLLIPLHGEKGGRLLCPSCVIDHGRRRRFGRAVLRNMLLFLKAGGTTAMLGKLQSTAVLASAGIADETATAFLPGYNLDDADPGELTLEVLNDAISLAHPDWHPPERKALAERVTARLTAMKPYTMPAPKPKPADSDGSAKQQPRGNAEPSRKEAPYPCGLCVDVRPEDYCETCITVHREQAKAEQERRQKKWAEEREMRLARQRTRRARIRKYNPLAKRECAECHEQFAPRRADAVYCSAACRQAAHRQRDGEAASPGYINTADVEIAIEAAFLADPDNAYTTADLCDCAFSGLNRIERKHRAAIQPAAKAVCMRLGERWVGVRAEDRGGTAVFFNRTSVMSYAMMRLKADPYLGGYRPKPGSWHCCNPRTEDNLRAMLAPGGKKHHLVVEGGAWWQHTQDDIKALAQTDRQNGVGPNSPSCYAEATA
jgi:hypothetical protein